MKRKSVSWKKRYGSKKKKSLFKRRSFWFFFATVSILGVLFWWVFLSDVFKISTIEISGNQKIPRKMIEQKIKEQISKEMIFFSSESIFLFDTGEVKKILAQAFPEIESILLKKRFPDILEIEIGERGAKAVICQENNYFLVDKDGIIFEDFHSLADKEGEGKEKEKERNDKFLETIQEQNNVDLIIRFEKNKAFSLGERAIDREMFAALLKINQQLRDSLNLDIEEFLIVSSFEFNAKTSEGFWLYFSLEKDIDLQIRELGLILKEELPLQQRGLLEYIDLRFNKILIYPDIIK